MFKVPEKYRITTGPFGSSKRDGNNGFFLIKDRKIDLFVIASDGEGWEHVSVSIITKTPTWEQMVLVKNLFWSEEDLVIQIHPPKTKYINCHEHCLHLWRPVNEIVPSPPTYLIGPA